MTVPGLLAFQILVTGVLKIQSIPYSIFKTQIKITETLLT